MLIVLAMLYRVEDEMRLDETGAQGQVAESYSYLVPLWSEIRCQ